MNLEDSITIQLSTCELSIIAKAAMSSGMSVSAFMIDASMFFANEILAVDTLKFK
jgi:uncharacterized protein (DUF1778 family)